MDAKEASPSAARIDWIDQAKGYAMLLVIFCHSPTVEFLVKIGYIFHVPLFFFLSGYVYNNIKYSDIKEFIKSRTHSIVIPYLCFSALGLVVMILLLLGDPQPLSTHLHKIGKAVVGTFLGVRNTSRFHGTLWFLACLLTVEAIYTLINRYTKRKIFHTLLIAAVFSLLGMLFVYKGNYKHQVPFNVDAAFVMIFFFALGNLWRSIDMHITNKWILSVLVAISLGAGLLNDRVDTFFLKFGNPILFYVASISAILFLVSFFEQLRPVKFISRIGKSSLVLLALHQWYIFGPLNFFLNKSGILISDSTIGRLGIGLSYTVISILILIPTAEYLQSHLPFVVGKKKA